MSSCRDHARFLGAYLDGELEAAQLLDIEGHVSACDQCRERVALDRATRASLKRQMKLAEPTVGQMDGLRARALAAMTAEKARGDAREERTVANQGFGWRSMVPLASAAALALAFGAMGKEAVTQGGNSDTVHAGFGDDLLAELIAEHSRPSHRSAPTRRRCARSSSTSACPCTRRRSRRRAHASSAAASCP